MEKSLKILLLEDSQVDAEIIQRLLIKEISACEIKLAENKKTFLSALDEFNPEVILSDNSLPRFNAMDALKIVRQRSLLIPFILITGTVSEEYAAGIIKEGADDYILKDRMARLPASIDSALRHRQAEKEILVNERQREFDHDNLRALINNTKDLMWSVDRDLKLITSNDSFNEVVALITGNPFEKGRDILSIPLTRDQHERYKLLYKRALTGETFTIIDHFMVASAEVWTEISFYPIRHGEEIIGTACFSHDITEQKKASAELLRLEQEKLESKIEEQKQITRAMLIAQEKERNDIGAELHDNVNQILAGTILLLSMAETDPETTQHAIVSSMNHLQQAILENRKIAHVFVAPDLKTESLETLLRKLTQNMLEVSNIEVSLDTSKFNEDLLDTDRKFNIYRIAQEQCTNIVKYAKATTVALNLVTTAKSFTMSISDNGIGMDTKKKTTGIGIRNIKDRLGLFNGTANIISAPGKGFIFEITIPL